MKKINPKTKTEKDKDHILITTGKDQVAIRLRKGDETQNIVFFTKAEMDEIVKEYNKIK
ncbi:hypothetical protein IH981_02100 [Patescibacteria group bacterium]|nr:hypothetical protein [Patescibacteria group bacterium]